MCEFWPKFLVTFLSYPKQVLDLELVFYPRFMALFYIYEAPSDGK